MTVGATVKMVLHPLSSDVKRIIIICITKNIPLKNEKTGEKCELNPPCLLLKG
jgi:hypothetical protein